MALRSAARCRAVFNVLKRWLGGAATTAESSPEPLGQVIEVTSNDAVARAAALPIETPGYTFPPLKGLAHFSRIWSSRPADLMELLGDESLEILDHAAAVALEVAEQGENALEYCRHAAKAATDAHAMGCDSLLQANPQVERWVRTIAWGLDASEPCDPVSMLRVDTSSPEGIAAIGRRASIAKPPAVLWWATEAEPPDALHRLAESTRIILLQDGAAESVEEHRGRTITSVNHAIVERTSGNGRHELELPGSAAVFQLMRRLTRPFDGSWHRIAPPAGFCSLTCDYRVQDVLMLRESDRCALVHPTTGDTSLLLSLTLHAEESGIRPASRREVFCTGDGHGQRSHKALYQLSRKKNCEEIQFRFLPSHSWQRSPVEGEPKAT